MKKIIFILFIFGFVSCKKKEKDWTCTCTIHASSGDYKVTEQIKNQIRNDADTQCSDFGHAKAGHPPPPYDCNIE